MTDFLVRQNGSVTKNGSPFHSEHDVEWKTFPLAELDPSSETVYTIQWSQTTEQQAQSGGIFVDAPHVSARTGGPTWWWSEQMRKWSPDNIDMFVFAPVCSQTMTVRFTSNTTYIITSNVSGEVFEHAYECAPSKGTVRLMYHFDPSMTNEHRINVSAQAVDLWDRLVHVEGLVQSIRTQDDIIQQWMNQGYMYDNDDLRKWSTKYGQCISTIGTAIGTTEVDVDRIRAHFDEVYGETRREIARLKDVLGVLKTYPELGMSILEVDEVIKSKEAVMDLRRHVVDKSIQDLELFSELLTCTANSTLAVNERTKHIQRIYDDMPTFK